MDNFWQSAVGFSLAAIAGLVIFTLMLKVATMQEREDFYADIYELRQRLGCIDLTDKQAMLLLRIERIHKIQLTARHTNRPFTGLLFAIRQHQEVVTQEQLNNWNFLKHLVAKGHYDEDLGPDTQVVA